MSDYVFYPVTVAGSSVSPPYTYTWSDLQISFSTGAYWAQESSPVIGTPPANTGTVPGAGDTAVLIAGTVSPADLALYNEVAPFEGDPTIKPASGEFDANVLINGGSVQLADLIVAGFSYGVSRTLVPTLTVQGGTLDITSNVSDTIAATVAGNAVTAAGGGTIDLSSTSLVQIGGTVESDIAFDFLDSSNESLQLNATANETITVSGMMDGNTIALTGIGPDISASGSYDAGTNQFIVTIGDPTTLTFDVANLADASSLHLVQNGNTFDLVTCFAAGTRIRTPSGDVAVEALAEGDPVCLAGSDAALPVRWIGRRRIDCRHHPRPELVWPVRIAAGAFGEAMPVRDVLLSPDHAVFVDGMLIPIKYLIDGIGIVQERRASVTYYHVELPRHAVILADGLPAESYLDTGDRARFDNAGDVVTLHRAEPPDAELASRVWEAKGCAPLVVTGPAIAAIPARLRERYAVLREAA